MYILLAVYNIALIFLCLPAAIIGFFMFKDKTHFRQRLGFGLPKDELNSSIWFHAASVGEVRSLAEIVSQIRDAYPNLSIVLSTMTETGYAAARDYIKADLVMLLPMENRIALRRCLKRYNTKLFFVVETELWPNMISVVSKYAPIVLLNARMSEKTFGKYMRLKFIFAPVLKKFKYIFTKSEEDKNRFEAIAGTEKVKMLGNIKYTLRSPAGIDPSLKSLEGKRIALAASTHNTEELFFLEALQNKWKEQFDQLVIVPRHINRTASIAESAKKLGFNVGLYSDNDFGKDLLIIDAFGLLNSLYQLSNKIFIGGSVVNIGGHNIFEALQYRKIPAVGVHMQNFTELLKIVEKYKILVTVADKKELLNYFLAETQEGDFESFFNEIKKIQDNYYSKIKECIKECIGY